MDTTWKQPHRQIHTLGTDVFATPRRISTEYDSRGMVSTMTSWDSATPGSGTILNQVQNVYNEFGQQSGHQALLAGVQALACCDSARDLPRDCDFDSQLTFVNSHVSLEMQAKACTPTKTLNGTQTAIISGTGTCAQQRGFDATGNFEGCDSCGTTVLRPLVAGGETRFAVLVVSRKPGVYTRVLERRGWFRSWSGGVNVKSMPLGIKAYVDFVFKKMFGSPENSAALIGLLNAILELPRPITDVTIQNPFSYKEFETAKFVTLDVKAVDSARRIFNVEMQISLHPGLLPRLVFYAAEMYTDQLSEYDDFDLPADEESFCRIQPTTPPI